MSPLLKALNNSEYLFVINFIVDFSWIQLLGEEGDRMQLAIMTLTQNTSYSEIAGIDL